MQLQRAVRDSGITPLDFLLSVMRDKNKDLDIRVDAAKAAAAYVHPKLAQIEHSGQGGGPIPIQITPDDACL